MTNDAGMENLTQAIAFDSEKSAEMALRPKTLDEFVGQKVVRQQLEIVLKSAIKRDDCPDHMLFSGPPGLGKTTLSMIVANEMGVNLKITSGPSLTHAGDLAAMLSSLEGGEVLFIDEIHRLAKTVQEMLYIAMEDFRVDIIVGKGVGSTSLALPLPKFTVIGATTRSGLLPGPLRDRFGFIAQMDYYDTKDLTQIIKASAKKLAIKIDDQSAKEIASRSRGTARIANRLLRRVRDYCEVHGDGKINFDHTLEALKIYQIDPRGLDILDQKVLKTIVHKFNGGPVGLSSLASALSEEEDTIASVSEPFLVREGFLSRTQSGRITTDDGVKYVLNEMSSLNSF